ncbi:beta-ketoacyl synthase N-terminal-like domain-containing protein [Streptomyces sp. FXJ1.4098]|nr:beta-ketoacyl synthase N-terminal-like domain-containing protein [Streptomyces sp. FXJ1.4098]
MAGRLPGSADLAEFWDHLEQGRDLVGEIPADRWDWRAHAGESRSRWGGFLTDVDRFDAAFFSISPREAELMDPQQRLLLEVVWSAIEDAGYRASDLAGKRVGVFIGTTNSDYPEVQRAAGRAVDAHTLTGAAQSIIPNRISYLLDLRGPSVAVDTACSSSLTAVHQAVAALRDGSCDLAIAGGVSLILDPGLYAALSQGEMLSEDGRCKAFDAAANGYVRGEGVGVVVLRDHAAARRDGDPVAAVIKATAVGHGGRTTSLTSPNPNAQTELLVEAYRAAGIDPRTVGYIEAHGTGTALGDPIEFGALKQAFAELYGDAEPGAEAGGPRCGIGSVKTNIGHLEAAAGIAGLLKVVLALRHRTLPASLHFHEPNPYLELSGSPFEIVDSTRSWPAPVAADGTALPRRAGVSSFGFGGANAHVVIEEAEPALTGTDHGRRASGPDGQLFVLSARTGRALREQARRLAAFVRAERPAPADVAHTLRMGREPMEHRLAFVARGRAELLDHLDAHAGGRTEPGALTGRVPAGPRRDATSRGAAWREYVRALCAERDLEALAQLWAEGANLDWSGWSDWSGLPPARRIGLPAYPFERTRHWVESTAGSGRAALLDENVSTFGESAFAKRLTGAEFFLADHVVGEERVLPGVVYLEMARLAGERAHGAARVRRIDDVVWAAPVALAPGQCHDLRVAVAPSGAFDIAGEHPHARGTLVFEQAGEADAAAERIDLAAVRSRCSRTRSRQEAYDYFESLGFRYGPSFRVIEELALADAEALARLRRPDVGDHRFHPSLLDGALQTAGWLVSGSVPHLPYSIGSVALRAELPEVCYAHVTVVQRRADGQVFDIALTAEDGTVVARIERFTLRAVSRPESGVHAFGPVWRETHDQADKDNKDDSDDEADPGAGAAAEVELLAVMDTGDGRAAELRGELLRLAPGLSVRVGDPGAASHLVHLAPGRARRSPPRRLPHRAGGVPGPDRRTRRAAALSVRPRRRARGGGGGTRRAGRLRALDRAGAPRDPDDRARPHRCRVRVRRRLGPPGARRTPRRRAGAAGRWGRAYGPRLAAADAARGRGVTAGPGRGAHRHRGLGEAGPSGRPPDRPAPRRGRRAGRPLGAGRGHAGGLAVPPGRRRCAGRRRAGGARGPAQVRTHRGHRARGRGAAGLAGAAQERGGRRRGARAQGARPGPARRGDQAGPARLLRRLRLDRRGVRQRRADRLRLRQQLPRPLPGAAAARPGPCGRLVAVARRRDDHRRRGAAGDAARVRHGTAADRGRPRRAGRRAGERGLPRPADRGRPRPHRGGASAAPRRACRRP